MSTASSLPWIETPDWRNVLAEKCPEAGVRAVAERFGEDGYVVLDAPIEDIQSLAAGIQASLAPAFCERSRVQDAWRTVPEARTIATAPKILRLLRQLYGRQPVPFQTLHFERGSEQLAHSDALHFHCLPQRFLCGVWVALEDIDEECGPLYVYPGSHRLPVWDLAALGLSPGPDTHRVAETYVHEWVQGLGLKKRVVTLKRGQAIVWAGNVLHGGERIRDPHRTRWSQVTHYFFEDCLYFNPLRSDLHCGRLHLRRVVNITNGRDVPHRYLGNDVVPNAEQDFWMTPSFMGFLKTLIERCCVMMSKMTRHR